MKSNKGITLVALIITIIVLLILAVVAISAVNGEGIISKAKLAKANYQTAQGEENTTLAGYQATLDSINGEGNGGNNPPSGGSTYLEVTGLPAGEESIAYEDLSSELKTAADEGKIIAVVKEGTTLAPIPNGFTLSTETSEQKISTGLVIKDSAGNEFVWVPVKNAIYDGTTAISSTYKPMAKLQSGSTENYEGVLYDFSGTTSTTALRYEKPCTVLNTEWQVDDYSQGITEELMQSTFNTMIKSVTKYGGFYVGRYETINTENSTLTVKAGIKGVDMYKNWYTWYEKSKTLTSNYVQSEMIWGCEWDAMLNWMLTGEEASKIDDNSIGNYSSSFANSGSTSTDIINNIYDLAGNYFEWTQEDDWAGRKSRGGCIDRIGNVVDRHGNDAGERPTYYGAASTARITLYIK